MRIGISGYATKTGIGYLIKDFKKFLPIDTHYVVSHEKQKVDTTMIDKKCVNDSVDVKEWLSGINKLIIVEQPKVKMMMRETTRLGIEVYCLVNIDWFNHNDEWVRRVKTFICPNIYTWTKLHFLGLKNIVYIPACIDTDYFTFTQRNICNTFLFNNGWGGYKYRKGLKETIGVFNNTEYPLVINSQLKIECNVSDNIKINYNNMAERKDTYDKGDVFVYPTKWEGYSMVILEAMACGLPVITTDGVPMNEYGTFLIKTDYNKQNLNNDFSALEWVINKKDFLRNIEYVYNKVVKDYSCFARDFVEMKHSWKVNLDKYYKVLGI